MNSFNLTINCEGTTLMVDASGDKSVLQILRDNQIHMSAPCGGRGSCGKCRIKIIKGSFDITEEDSIYFTREELNGGFRLACMYRVKEDSEISVEFEKKFDILTVYEKDLPVGNGSQRKSYTVDSGFSLQTVQMNAQRSLTELIESHCPGRIMGPAFLRKLAILLNPQDDHPEKTNFHILTDNQSVRDIFINDPPALAGVAIDIGTTTICFEVVDLLSGHKLGGHAIMNRQREYGADVISRIQYAEQGNLEDLRRLVVQDISAGIQEISLLYHIETENIYRIIISGNTTMLHLLLGIPCGSLGRFPFTPVMTNMGHYAYTEIFENDICNCSVTVLPSISAYVGADITSGMVFCGDKSGEALSLLIDLGTNGEMALFTNDKILCTSTAAGPAFEGGNISFGTGSIPGAISFARYENGKLVYETIGGQKPIGICGSGAIDIVAALVQAEIIEETGLMDEDYFETGFPVVQETGITFTQQDIREVQLAKAAVRAGIEVLLMEAGVSYSSISNVYLAGGFGHKLNLDSAEAIGLIPSSLRDKVVAVGNSSLGGCVRIMTDQAAEAEATAIARKAQEINLSHDKRFNNLFMEYMYFSS